MTSNQSQTNVNRFEFCIVIGQLFLVVGLLGLASVIGSSVDDVVSVSNFAIKLLVTFLAFGMSLYYSASALQARSQSPQADRANEVV